MKGIVAAITLAVCLVIAFLAPMLGQAQSISTPAATYVVMANNVTDTTGTALRCTDGMFNNYSTVAVQAVGVISAVLHWEASVNGAAYVAVPFTDIGAGTAALTHTTSGLYRFDCTGLGWVRLRVTDWESGTISVTGYLAAQ